MDIDSVIVIATEIFCHYGSHLLLHFEISNNSLVPTIVGLAIIRDKKMNFLLSEGFFSSADYHIPFRFQLIFNLFSSAHFTIFFKQTYLLNHLF